MLSTISRLSVGLVGRHIQIFLIDECAGKAELYHPYRVTIPLVPSYHPIPAIHDTWFSKSLPLIFSLMIFSHFFDKLFFGIITAAVPLGYFASIECWWLIKHWLA